jgi:hypothetical protein
MVLEYRYTGVPVLFCVLMGELETRANCRPESELAQSGIPIRSQAKHARQPHARHLG